MLVPLHQGIKPSQRVFVGRHRPRSHHLDSAAANSYKLRQTNFREKVIFHEAPENTGPFRAFFKVFICYFTSRHDFTQGILSGVLVPLNAIQSHRFVFGKVRIDLKEFVSNRAFYFSANALGNVLMNFPCAAVTLDRTRLTNIHAYAFFLGLCHSSSLIGQISGAIE